VKKNYLPRFFLQNRFFLTVVHTPLQARLEPVFSSQNQTTVARPIAAIRSCSHVVLARVD